MTVLAFPSIIPNTSEFGLESNTQTTRSELNGVIQTLALPGDRWTANLTFNNLIDPKASILRAFIASLRGQAGRFYLTPPAYTRGGVAAGTPLVKGAGQVGSTLLVDGCFANVEGWLNAGDYFQVGNELKMLTSDANTNGSGETTLTFVPPIRTSPADNASVVVSSPKTVMMLSDPKQAKWQASPTPIYTMAIACEEPIA